MWQNGFVKDLYIDIRGLARLSALLVLYIRLKDDVSCAYEMPGPCLKQALCKEVRSSCRFRSLSHNAKRYGPGHMDCCAAAAAHIQ